MTTETQGPLAVRPRDPPAGDCSSRSASSTPASRSATRSCSWSRSAPLITTVAWLIQLFGGGPLGGGHEPSWFTFSVTHLALADGRLRQPRRGAGRGPRPRPGGEPAGDAHRGDREDARRRREVGRRAGPRRRRRGRGRRGDPRRRHRDRGDRLGRRVGDHRRVGAGDPRGRRRPLRGHRRHQGPLGPDRRRNHPGARRLLPRPHDRPGRGRRAAQDAERDRARHPARGADPDLRHRRRQPAPVRALRRHRTLGDDADRAAGGADPDHDRGAALGDRDRRHGPPGAPQRARPLGPRGRGLRRLRRPAARQDRDDHARQPRGDRVRPDAGRQRGGAGRGGADVLARRRDPGGALDRRPRQGLRHPRARLRRPRADLRPLHRRRPG